MKKNILIAIVAMVALTLTSCTKQEVNRGLYALPALMIIGAVLYARKGLQSWNSGSEQQTKKGIIYSDKKGFPTGYAVLSGCLVLAAIASSIWIYSDNRNYDPKKDGPYPETPAPDGRESAEELARKADSTYNLK